MKLTGLDIGTTTICGLVLDAGTGEILSVVTRPNTSGLPGSGPWEALQDPVAIVRLVRDHPRRLPVAVHGHRRHR